VITIAVPVIVNVALRAAPVLAATANWTLPVPVPDAPWVTVRNVALLTAVHAHVDGVVTEMLAVPPAAVNAVVVVPVMIWHPPPVEGVGELLDPPHASEDSSSAAQAVTRDRRERWPDRYRFMSTPCEELNDLRQVRDDSSSGRASVHNRTSRVWFLANPVANSPSHQLQLNDATYQVTRRVIPSAGMTAVPWKSLWHSRHTLVSSTAVT
jgi:hypothetical protein